MELFKAHHQWATRPDDERFWNLEEAKQAMASLRERTAVLQGNMAHLRAEKIGDDIAMVGNRKVPVVLSNWAFTQVAQRAKAPPSYLQSLPTTLAVQNLNYGLSHRYGSDVKEENDVRLMVLQPEDPQNEAPVMRAMSSEMYQHIWNYECFERLQDLEARGWRVPPARPAVPGSSKVRIATEADVLKSKEGGFLSICVGDKIAPAGIYASDHDMFVFMVNEDQPIDAGNGKMLSKGFFLWNGEVPGVSFGITMFLYNHVCGNHIVWGAQDVTEIRFRHVGKEARKRAFGDVQGLALSSESQSVNAIEDRIKAAQEHEYGPDKDKTLQALNALCSLKKIRVLGKKVLEEAWDVAEANESLYGPPTTVWGMVNGLTQLSQEKTAYADDRNEIDRAAGKLLEYF